MVIVVAYDVNTETAAGRRRLRRVANVCQDYGQRVQYSVFECIIGERELVLLRDRLQHEMDEDKDSIRIYFLDETTRRRTEHYGVSKPRDLEAPLVV